MEIIKNTLTINESVPYIDSARPYQKTGDVYLAVETTGLSPERNQIAAVSFGSINDNAVDIKTFFSEGKDDELNVIERSVKEIKKARRLITWNGKSFDLRFFGARAGIYGIKTELSANGLITGTKSVEICDIPELLRPMRKLLADGSLSQYSLMDQMGLKDDSLPDGRTVVTLYKSWLSSGEDRYRALVIDHSVSRITGIINLMSLISCTAVYKTRTEITTLKRSGSEIELSGTTDQDFPLRLTFSQPGTTVELYKNALHAAFTLSKGKLRVYYPDPSSYVRLKENGELLPKELASSLPVDTYEKVTRDDCYTLAKVPDEDERLKKQLRNYIQQIIKR